MDLQRFDLSYTPKVVEYVPGQQTEQTDELEAPAMEYDQTQ